MLYPVPMMQRLFLALALTGALLGTAFAADGANPAMGPLAAGKPAGVQKAQATPNNYVWWVMAGSLAAIVGLAALGQSTTSTATS
jgi:phosphate/sulfate permease